jgi:hypothetical protein
MRRMISALALLATVTVVAGAQQMDHSKMMGMHADSSHTMKTTCPLHLTTLNLSAAQQVVFDSLKKEHEGVMKTAMGSHDMAAMTAGGDHKMMKMSADDHAAMEKNMQLTIAAVRAILSDSQRQVFDAAVTAHETEMKAMMAKDGDCMTCCLECMPKP